MNKFVKLVTVASVVLGSLVVNVSNVSANEQQTPSGIPMSQLETKIDQFMVQHIGKDTPGASVAVVSEGEIIFSKGYGFADIDKQVKVNPDTVFEYGSISKLFVWTSAMQLVEAGKLDLDRDIREYLPEDFNQQFKTKYPITMRNIMNHSSGFGEYPFDLIYKQAPKKEMTLAEAILAAHPEQYYQPGTASSYSNYATAIAGLVVESISGESFDQYEKAHIFDTIGMESTAGNMAWKDNEAILSRKSQGYLKTKEGFKNNGWSYIPMYPAGSVNGTAEDLAKFAIELMKNDQSKLLKQNTLTQMLEPSYETQGTGTAHGFFEFDAKKGKAYGHGGNTAAFSAQLAFHPETKFAVVVLTNTASELEVTMGLHDLLIGNSMKQIKAGKAEMPDVAQYEGNYTSMRRCVGTPLDFISYLQQAKVEKLADNKLAIHLHGFKGEYVQTQPNEFKLVSRTHPLFTVMFPTLRFQAKDNGQYMAQFGHGQDFEQTSGIRSDGALIGNFATLSISALFFIAMALLNLIRKIKKTPASKLLKAQVRINLVGLVAVATLIAMLGMVFSNPLLRYTSILYFQIAFIFLALLSVLVIAIGLKAWKTETSLKVKGLYLVSSIMIISFINVLGMWNLFNLAPLFK